MRGIEAVAAGLALALGLMTLSGQAGGQTHMTDPYQWLEDVHGAKPLAWVKDENAKTLKVLKSDPDYETEFSGILAVLDAADRIPFGALDHRYVFNFWQDKEHPKGVWRRTTIADYAKPSPQWDILLDVDALAASEHENWVFQGADCDDLLNRCLISLSRGGGDAKVVREFDLKTRQFLKDGFSLPEAKSQATYVDENRVLFGTDFGPGSLTSSGYPRIVKLWTRGQSLAAARTIYEGTHEDVSVDPFVLHQKSGPVPMVIRGVSFFEAEYRFVRPDGTTFKVALPLSAVVQGIQHDRLLVTLRDAWQPPGTASAIPKGALIAVLFPADAPPKVDVLYVPGPRDAIEQVAVGRDAVYAVVTENVIGQVRVFRNKADTDAWTSQTLALPGSGTVGVVSTNDFGPEAQFRFENYLTPPTLYEDAGDGHPAAIKSLPARFDASGLVTEQFEAISKDGTKIPYFVTRPKTLRGPLPAILYGYGGFEISLTPSYSANFGKWWLTKGGIYAVANIRGGGEFGPAWHQAALKENRQRAYDDFAAVAEDMIRRGLTTGKKLGIMGGSNGGLLVSATMVERPDLFGAVVCQVPLIDMIRYTHIGAGASWIGEYGDPANPEVAEYIRTYSPYQNVKPGVHYPPVFFVTATSDDRVTPVHARKMAAKMIAQGHDVMFYENTDGGHAAAADHRQAAEMWALSFVYLKEKLGL